MNRAMLDQLIATVTDEELRFIASADYGCDIEAHEAALRRVLFEQHGTITDDQYWFPYEVVELAANSLKPGHEREFALCTLLVLHNVAAGSDRASVLKFKFDSRADDYQALPADLQEAILSALAEIDWEA